MEFWNNLITVLKNENLKEYAQKEAADLGKLIFQKDIEAGTELGKNTVRLIFSIPDLIFLDKLKRFLCGTYEDFGEQVKMSSKFTRDNSEYVEFVKKQIYILNEMENDEKIDFYANLTRACLLEQIDIPLYFKLANILRQCTTEELFYLRDNVNGSIDKLNIFVDTFLGNGLAKMTLATVSGANQYAYTQLAKKFVNYSMLFATEKYVAPVTKERLLDIDTIETKTSSPFMARSSGNVGIDAKSIKAFK